MATLYLWQRADITSFGPDVFSDTQDANGGAVGNSSFTIAPGASAVPVEVTDNEAFFNNSDTSSQVLTGATVFNGTSFAANTAIKPEYAYVVRPAGSTDPGERITVYGVKIGNHIEGVASDGPLVPGVSYEVILISGNSPAAAYSGLYVCFAEGTRILTETGGQTVENLRPGCRLATADHGLQPLRWIVGRRVIAQGPAAPVVFAPDEQGGKRLMVSQQHRMVETCKGQEILVAAKALVGRPGVTIQSGGTVAYYHLLMDRHEILFAEGRRAESFNPGAEAWKNLAPATRADLQTLCPRLASGPFDMARPVLGPNAWRRQMGLGPLCPGVQDMRTSAYESVAVCGP
ncbi:Hint domain-containing protein [Rhodovulum euryhalinum]|uniref:Hint domain-containing protein n=1 Tax=Rhodovulum euryhalinum TaxID=35805 RepID=A0A4R2KJ85_9RHOB|nr:Hint domain-containing protein [Rhodovulum euryhalinum]TCO70068.1 Hint domain-containing protein [Rhodovulum euryhalinum]